jgi:hypothetical protein
VREDVRDGGSLRGVQTQHALHQVLRGVQRAEDGERRDKETREGKKRKEMRVKGAERRERGKRKVKRSAKKEKRKNEGE